MPLQTIWVIKIDASVVSCLDNQAHFYSIKLLNNWIGFVIEPKNVLKSIFQRADSESQKNSK